MYTGSTMHPSLSILFHPYNPCSENSKQQDFPQLTNMNVTIPCVT